jgi:hypothetical protein
MIEKRRKFELRLCEKKDELRTGKFFTVAKDPYPLYSSYNESQI